MEQLADNLVVEDTVPCKVETFDVYRLRKDFPILHKRIHGEPLAYLDNAATSQKPRAVIDAVKGYYEGQNANIHRGVHDLSEVATKAYEDARESVRRFIGAQSRKEIVFVRGTTEAINLVAFSYGRQHVGEGDEIIITTMEHHSNIVPWQIFCEMTGAVLRVVQINDHGEIIFEEYTKLLNERTKLVSVVYISNSLGTINPVEAIIDRAHERNVAVLLDGAQAVPHKQIDVRKLDCDFFAFSGHKVFGPTGIGVLYVKEEHLEKMAPYQGGGDMIKSVTFERTTYNELPHKFEAGTPNIAGVIGLGRALEYVRSVGYENIEHHETELLEYCTDVLSSFRQLRIIGTAAQKAGVVSFVLDDIHPHDVGTVLDQYGIAIRTGHHCTQPVMDRFNVPATSRASFAFYNTKEEIDRLAEGIHKVIKLFA